MIINNEIFESYLNCKYKAYLKLSGSSGNITEYEIMQHEIKALYKRDALRNVLSAYKEKEILNNQDLRFVIKDGKKVIVNAYISSGGLQTYCDFMERVSGKSDLGAFHYVPALVVKKEKLSKEDKLMMAYNCLVVGNMQNRQLAYGEIVYGKQFKISKIKLNGKSDIAKKLIDDLKESCDNDRSPKLILNRHCQICEFKDSCRTKAIEKDDLSLLSGISAKEIEIQNKKGVFTVTQYSYSFRPRRKFRKSYPFNLKALAIREKKIYIYGTPEIPTAGVQIYLDVEGDTEKDFYYLIGVSIVQNATEKHYTFWAENQDQEGEIFSQFLNILKDYSEFKLYHYGSYETKFLRKMQKGISKENAQIFNKIVANSVNVLSTIYSNIFFPTYSNSLKDIGIYLGFKWSDENASGIQSLVWRKQFEIANDQKARSKLVEYNLEDCLALNRVVEFISQINLDVGEKIKKNSGVVYVNDWKDESNNRFGRVNFLFQDLEYINQRAYFDYQREKIFVRTNKILKHAKPYCRSQEKRSYKINKHIEIRPQEKCPYCAGRVYRNKNYSKKVFDLKFSDSSIKRWIAIYHTSRMRCFKCGVSISAKGVQKIPKYGHGLISWVIYHNIVNHQHFTKLYDNLDDLFSMSINVSTLHRFKELAARYYRETYQRIIDKIVRGNIIHADETEVTIKGKNGYVWVFTNMEEVYFLFTPTREGNFLKEFLKGFKGVLISDFYAAYDSMGCPQQKCLIHLIRDLNDDLLKNPFDEEYKNMVVDFSVLLRKIISSVDKYGLKRKNLNKHKKDVGWYFKKKLNHNYISELAKKYQKRFNKNKDVLFTFLNFDGVPWNNNNAEHAIKHFANYRKTLSSQSSEMGLRDYLVLLSIYQTCKYKGINFLKFLLSKEKDIDLCFNSQRRKGY